jgi:uncharacterized protein involved in response to NO
MQQPLDAAFSADAAMPIMSAGRRRALMPLLHLGAFAWAVAFLGFAVAYGPILLRPRQ